MNIIQLCSLISSPEIDEVQIEEIEKLIEHYPYFQTVRMLKMKYSILNNTAKKNSDLLYAGDIISSNKLLKGSAVVEQTNTYTDYKKMQKSDYLMTIAQQAKEILHKKTETNDTKTNIDNVQNQEFASETLALIYSKQGFYDKAIDVYRKLSLLNPEKSNYFAVRISELEKSKSST